MRFPIPPLSFTAITKRYIKIIAHASIKKKKISHDSARNKYQYFHLCLLHTIQYDNPHRLYFVVHGIARDPSG